MIYLLDWDEDTELTNSLDLETSSFNKNRSYVYKISFQDLIEDDDIFYSANKTTINDLFPILIMILTVVSVFTILVFLIYTCVNRRKRTHPTYRLLNHYLVLNIILSLNVCLKILTSSLIKKSRFYIAKTGLTCSLHQFVHLFVESTQSFQFLLIWLITLSERNYLNFNFLYADYELASLLQQQQLQQRQNASDPEAGTESADQSATNRRIHELQKKTARNFFKFHSRSFMLAGFYVVMFFLAALMSPTSSYESRGVRLCLPLMHNGLVYMFQILFFFVFYLPIIYYFLIMSTFFSKYFGGPADPILDSLDSNDHSRLELIKKVTLFKCLIEFFMEIHTSSYFYLSVYLYELFRIVGYLAIWFNTYLFLKYENFFSKIKQTCFNSVSSTNIITFRNSSSANNSSPSTANVDYTNLVESAD